jgi:predicted acetyltransferase
MNVDVAPGEREPLLSLMQLYVYDLSAALEIDLGDDGRYQTPSINQYWSDPRCHPFLVRADGKLAGFALVQRRSRLDGDESVTDMAEFFIVQKFRGRGVGERAATTLFNHFSGRWEVRQRAANTAATTFWRRVIDRYTGGLFDEVTLKDARWRGPVQRFDSSTSCPRPDRFDSTR